MGNLIVKSNAFVGASYGLGVVEQRLVLLAILKARESDNVAEVIGKTLTIHASDYMAHFGVDRATAYKCLENAVNGLYESEYRFIEILPNGERKTHRERFVSGITYSDGLGQVELRFTPETVPLVVGLSENFTKYEIEQVSRLSSQYALRLYEMLCQWRAKGRCTFKLAELRFKFGLLDDEYPRMFDFKRYVLDMAVKEINEHTDLAVSYEQHKQGRKIIGFTFTIKQKPQAKAITKSQKTTKPTDRDPNTSDMLHGLTDKELAVVHQRANEYIAHLESKGEAVNDFYRKNIEQKAIDERWGLDEYYEQLQQAENERLARREQAERERQAKLAEQAEKQRQEAENAEFIAYFESLPHDEQERILDEVKKQIPFKTGFDKQTAHKNMMYRIFFKMVMGGLGLIMP